ncbi:MAG: tetratricopeptide repeat protein [Planctomycetota bacterium]|jgi:tetratricopeptide (TPR) repeat protein
MSEKKSAKDKMLDKVPIFGSVRRAKGFLRRNKGWIYFALALAVLFIIGPLLRIVATFFSIVAPAIRVMLDNPVGRVAFFGVVTVVVGWILWRRVRERVFRVYGLNAMRSFLDGLNLMVLGRWNRAIGAFEKVVGTPRWVNLEDGVPEHRDIRRDAMLKIALCHLERNRANEAKSWLLRVHESEILSDHVRRNLGELRALSYDRSDEIEPETILKELERAEKRDARNRRVLQALRDRLEAEGDLKRAAAVTKKLVAASEGRDKERAEEDLSLLEYRLAHRALGAGESSRTPLKALAARAHDPRSALLLGDLALERGDVRGALKAWSRAVSLPVFDRLEQMLADGKLPAEKDRRMLLDYFPYSGTMLVLARYHEQNGDSRKAKAAVEKALEAGGAHTEALRLYAAALQREGDEAGAAELYRRALAATFA